MTKYIFVTGGVVSGLGKGITAQVILSSVVAKVIPANTLDSTKMELLSSLHRMDLSMPLKISEYFSRF